MSQYNGNVWPAMQYPGPASVTGNGGVLTPVEVGPAPPLEVPQPDPLQVSLIGGLVEPAPPPVPEPVPPVLVQSFAAVVPAPLVTTYAPPYYAKDAVDSFFGIVSQNGLASNPHWYFAHLGPVRAATTAALPAYTPVSSTLLVANVNGALPAQDGVPLVQGDLLLVKDEVGANAPNNGVYVVFKIGTAGLPWELERVAIDPQICVSDVTVELGTVNAGSFWAFATDAATFTLGATDIVWLKGEADAYSNDPPRTGAPPYLARYTGNI